MKQIERIVTIKNGKTLGSPSPSSYPSPAISPKQPITEGKGLGSVPPKK